MREAQEFADRAEFQTIENSFRHGMRSPNQTIAEACAQGNAFVRDQYIRAWEALDQGRRQDAFWEFGIGLHALQDSTSPAHRDFQVWDGGDSFGFPSGTHIWHDTVVILPNTLLVITEEAWGWFESRELPDGNLFPCRCE